MNYKIDPGLYALGNPGPASPVLVSANYKMSFDRLRESLPGRDAWILVLDTDGVNVWCAAGKGTFGTGELTFRIEGSGLAQVIDHNRIIVPQLGAVGISAHRVLKLSGFKVKYGPVRASDLPAFIDAGNRATPEMRVKTFNTVERLALVPVELVHALKTLLMIMPLLFVLDGLAAGKTFLSGAFGLGLLDTAGLLSGIFAGCVLTPLLLPLIPGRAFSAKGIISGLACAAAYLLIRSVTGPEPPHGTAEIFAWLLLIPAVSAYLAMNYTGCSTFTSLSGVKKEMRWAVPMEIAAVVTGTVLWCAARFT